MFERNSNFQQCLNKQVMPLLRFHTMPQSSTHIDQLQDVEYRMKYFGRKSEIKIDSGIQTKLQF
jgi:hypothetical protein